MKVPVMGSMFGGCTCGEPLTAGVPCHHMVAVVKSYRILGLNESNAMPKWWTTEMWRLQYPQEGNALCDMHQSGKLAVGVELLTLQLIEKIKDK